MLPAGLLFLGRGAVAADGADEVGDDDDEEAEGEEHLGGDDGAAEAGRGGDVAKADGGGGGGAEIEGIEAGGDVGAGREIEALRVDINDGKGGDEFDEVEGEENDGAGIRSGAHPEVAEEDDAEEVGVEVNGQEDGEKKGPGLGGPTGGEDEEKDGGLADGVSLGEGLIGMVAAMFAEPAEPADEGGGHGNEQQGMEHQDPALDAADMLAEFAPVPQVGDVQRLPDVGIPRGVGNGGG